MWWAIFGLASPATTWSRTALTHSIFSINKTQMFVLKSHQDSEAVAIDSEPRVSQSGPRELPGRQLCSPLYHQHRPRELPGNILEMQILRLQTPLPFH
jgi:hypothetical protein